ncbi:uncharacterized protein LOC111087457 [Limulus polyphemus]|uniref:Uncharacterized protein LOC111087457 n=1 Tax=Limulus polyphemus TaxID=6850 RepID=A0ABM1T1T8_LIMPO|nr:uncharacterized protein LOC111087457 [Limulus polyphemus]
MEGSEEVMSAAVGKTILQKHIQPLLGVVLLLGFTVVAVCMPKYINAVNVSGDVYGGLLFLSLGCLVVLSLATVLNWLVQHKTLRCTTGQARAAIIPGLLLAGSGFLVLFSRDRYRVPCHLQEPICALLFPVALVVSFFCGGSGGFSLHKVVSFVGVLSGLFLSIVSQILDTSYCYGSVTISWLKNDLMWDTNVQALWTLVGCGGLVLFVVGQWKSKNLLSEQEEPKEEKDVTKQTEIAGKCWSNAITLATVVQFSTTIVVVALFWVDIFWPLGKAGSAEEMIKLLRNTFRCHFSSEQGCEEVALFGWVLLLLYSVFLPLLLVALHIFQDLPQLMAVETLALPLSIIWCGAEHSFRVETGFALIGLLLMSVSILIYRQFSEPKSTAKYVCLEQS